MNEKEIAQDYEERIAESMEYYGIPSGVATREAVEWIKDRIQEQLGCDKQRAGDIFRKAMYSWRAT